MEVKVEDERRRGVIPEFQCCVVLVTMTDGILSKYGVTVFTRPGTGSWTITAFDFPSSRLSGDVACRCSRSTLRLSLFFDGGLGR